MPQLGHTWCVCFNPPHSGHVCTEARTAFSNWPTRWRLRILDFLCLGDAICALSFFVLQSFFPGRSASSAPQRSSRSLRLHVQDPLLRFFPHDGHTPRQSARHTGYVGRDNIILCLTSSVKSTISVFSSVATLAKKSGTSAVKSKSVPQREHTASKSCSSLPRTMSSRPASCANSE